jgi:hypothetical protein
MPGTSSYLKSANGKCDEHRNCLNFKVSPDAQIAVKVHGFSRFFLTVEDSAVWGPKVA